MLIRSPRRFDTVPSRLSLQPGLTSVCTAWQGLAEADCLTSRPFFGVDAGGESLSPIAFKAQEALIGAGLKLTQAR